MKLKKIAAVISAAALALSLAGCGNDPVDDFFNTPPNVQTSGTTLSPFTSTPAESKPAAQLPDIPVNDASAFEYTYNSELGGMVITDYKLQSPKINIPDKLENENVVKVDFSGVSKDITHIIMPDSVQGFSFSDTIKGALQFVNIPDSVTRIANGAFEDCINLTNIIIPDSVTEIGEYAFYGCTELTSVTIPDSVTEIGSEAFLGCTRLASITIPNSVTAISNFAFAHCESLTSITIPNRVTKIGTWAFHDCTGLASVTIPDSVTMIVNNVFDGCENIKATYKGKTYDYEHIYDLYEAINGN